MVASKSEAGSRRLRIAAVLRGFLTPASLTFDRALRACGAAGLEAICPHDADIPWGA